MRSDKGRAFVLRREGKSYREISKELGVAKSTLSTWFRGVDFSEAIRTELTKQAAKRGRRYMQQLNDVRGIALEAEYAQAEKEALKEMSRYRNIPLFTAAVTAYWCRGDRAHKNAIRMSSTDPDILLTVVTFFEVLFGVDKHTIRLALFLNPEHDEAKCKRYWQRTLGVKQFQKTQILEQRSSKGSSKYGTCRIILSNTYLKKKMDIWIDQFPEMVLNTVPKRIQRL